MPLPTAAGGTGALALGYDPPGRATPDRVEAAMALAPLVAATIRDARRPAPPVIAPHLEGDAAPRLALAQALTDVLAATSGAPDVAAAARAAATIVQQVIPATDTVNIWALDENEGELARVVTVGVGADDTTRPRRLLLEEDTGAGSSLRQGRILTWEGDRDAWPEVLRAYAQGHGLVTVTNVPLLSGGAVTGVITRGSRSVRTLTAEETTFLTALAGHLGAQLDIVRGHTRIEAERRRLRTVLETMPEGLVILRADGSVDLYNQAAEDLLGQAPGHESLDERARRYGMYTPDGRPISGGDMPGAHALRGNTLRAFEYVVRRPDGIETPLVASAGPVLRPDGSVDGAIVVFQDITRLKDLDRLKDDFINAVSHELRTPTTTVRGGALTLLRRGDRLDEETRRQLLQDIAEESERLHHLVEDLLWLSRTQAGMQITPEPVRLHRLVNSVILDMGAWIGGRALTVDVPPALPVVDADPIALEKVLRNLIENAVTYSPRGERVEVTAERAGDAVLVGVLDRGSGFTGDDVDRIFEPFYRLPAAKASGAPGAGLGLAVCRRLVESQGGRIWAERRPGGGAAFRFTLPIATAPVE
ncbi:MAG: ATP-binding protein [Dehalococcoidia bacterium]